MVLIWTKFMVLKIFFIIVSADKSYTKAASLGKYAQGSDFYRDLMFPCQCTGKICEAEPLNL